MSLPIQIFDKTNISKWFDISQDGELFTFKNQFQILTVKGNINGFECYFNDDTSFILVNTLNELEELLLQSLQRNSGKIISDLTGFMSMNFHAKWMSTEHSKENGLIVEFKFPSERSLFGLGDSKHATVECFPHDNFKLYIEHKFVGKSEDYSNMLKILVYSFRLMKFKPKLDNLALYV
jgi:hypothetical protein